MKNNWELVPEKVTQAIDKKLEWWKRNWKKKPGLSLNSTKQKRYLRYLTDIQKVSIGAELAWTTVT